jgi:hypothetical protein
MKIPPFITTLLFLLSLFACQKDDAGAQVRLYNDSNFVLDSVQLANDGAGPLFYTNVASGTYSEYQSIPFLFEIVTLRVHIGAEELDWTPIDYLGFQSYEEGRYTYRLIISGEEEPQGMLVEFEED